MRKKIGCLGVLALLVCLLTLCTAPTVYAQAGVPTGTANMASAEVGDAERIEALTALIVMYSEQLEEYDRSNGSFVVACVGIVGVVLGIAFNLLTSRKEKEREKRPDYGMAVLFALITGTMALCLYVFSMQCRRVVFFRGYLTYLERELSELTGIPMVFNSEIVGSFLGRFHTMNAGFAVMGITVSVAFVVSLYFCLYFATEEGAIPNSGPCKLLRRLSQIVSQIFSKLPPKWFWRGIRKFFSWLFRPSVGLFLIVAVFGVCCGICVYDLCTNSGIPKDVYDTCLTFPR